MKSSPIDEFHQGNHATFVEDAGWRLPAHFGDPLAEYRAVRSRAGWLDQANRAVLSFSGPDARDWLQGMVSNDIKVLTPGAGTHAAILNIQGKILADIRVLCTENDYLIDVWEPRKAAVLTHLEGYLIADEVEIDDRSGDITHVSLQGPEARGILSDLVKTDALPDRDLAHRSIELNGDSVCIVAASKTGEEGFDLLLAPDYLRQLIARERNLSSTATIPWVGLEAQKMLRIEAGIPLYGVDMTENTLLLEANLDTAVSFTKGCYLGQEVVERIHSRGHVNKKLVGLQCSGSEVPSPADVIDSDARPGVGVITSAVFSPHLGVPVALGYVNREYTGIGQPLLVQHGEEPIPAVVARLPFFSRS